MKKSLLILITLLTTLIGHSQIFTNSFITYEVIPSTTNVKIINYDIAGGTVVNIPSTVTNTSITYSVTSIGVNAFFQKSLTDVVIPNSVTNIGFASFQNNSLTTINIPSSVTIIEHRAFEANQITAVTIPSNVISLGVGVFRYNPLVCVVSESVVPPTISTGGLNDSFIQNRSSISLSIPTGTLGAYASALWTGFGSVTEGLTGTFTVDNITYQILPNPNNEVVIIGYNTAGGTVVNIPATVSSACTNFSVVNIGFNAFNGKNLTTVIIPNSVTNIGNSAFQGNNLTSVTIPNSVTYIDIEAFYGNLLNSVTLSNNLNGIGVSAFAFNDLLSVTIPNSVLTINDGAFVQNNNLSNVVIGNSVNSIGNYVFRFNQLTSITIPSSVTTIGSYAFDSNPLTNVFSESTTPPTITTGVNDTFSNNRGTIHLHIPNGTTGVYVTNAGALWTGFNPVTEDASLSVSDFELNNNIKIISASDEIRVTHSNNIQLQNYTIYTILGTIVATGKENKIPTATLASGIYILRFDFDKGIFSKKVIIN